jgi:hypothetical protein
MKILVATNNPEKMERYRKLLRDADVELLTPAELNIEPLDIEEVGETLAENAELKARAYFGLTDLPILANDTGVWVDGEGMVTAPKRIALGDRNEKDMTKLEIAEALMEFWKNMARKYGGEVDAAWPESFVLLMPDRSLKKADSRREVILTDRQFGPIHLDMPLRPLYISKVTGKPAIEHTREEEDAELAPVREALLSLLS